MKALITNGGPHSAEDFAIATAAQLFELPPEMETGRRMLAEKTRLAIAEMLTKHHGGVQERERGHLAAAQENVRALADHPRLNRHVLDEQAEATAEAEAVMPELEECVKDTPWSDFYKDGERRKVAIWLLASHFMTSKDIERQWHRSRSAA